MTLNRDLFWTSHPDELDAFAEQEYLVAVRAYLAEHANSGLFLISSADNFRTVNQRFERPHADGLLRNIWDRLSTDALVRFAARFSGDGILLLVDSTKQELSAYIARHMSPHMADEGFGIYRSVGCIWIDSYKTTQEWFDVFEYADMAHTHAKKRGGNMALLFRKPDESPHESVVDCYTNPLCYELLFAGSPSRSIYEPRN